MSTNGAAPHRRRLLFVSHYPAFGGPTNRAMRLSAPLRERGWETLVLLPDEPGNAVERLRSADVPVVTMPLHRLRAVGDMGTQSAFARSFTSEVGRLRGVIRRERIDLVVGYGTINPHAAIAGHLEGVPVVWQIVDTRIPMSLRRATMPLVRSVADVVMTTGPTIAGEYPGTGAFGERLVPFFSPVDVEHFRPDAQRRAAARAELGLGPDDVVVGNVSNLNPQKGHHLFIEAAGLLRERFPHVRFALLGAEHETHDDYSEGLWQHAADVGLQLGEDLVFADPGSRVCELAPALDLFWLTSQERSEGVPTVVMEAMAMGLPVVSTEVGGVADIVRDGETGLLVAPGDAAALAARTAELLADEARRAALADAGRAFAVERCRTEVCVDTHLRAFDLAVAHRAARSARDGRTGRTGHAKLSPANAG